jgi:hypothetical protein
VTHRYFSTEAISWRGGPVLTSADPTPNELDVEEHRPAACWSVQEGDWCDVLPADIAALLAPPLTVSAQSAAPARRLPAPRDNSRPDGYAPARPGDDSRGPRFLPPAPPLRLRNRRPGNPG